MPWEKILIELATGSVLGLLATVAIILALRKLLRIELTLQIGEESYDDSGDEEEEADQGAS